MMNLMGCSRTALCLLVLCGGTAACAPEPGSAAKESVAHGTAPTGAAGTVVASVDGAPVTDDLVVEVMESADAGLSPDAALEAVLRHRVLADEARRRGFDDHPQVTAVRKAALAAALLDESVMDGVTEETIPLRVIEAYYESNKSTYVHGVKRRVVHFVALTGEEHLTDAAAKALADEVYQRARGAATAQDFEKRAKDVLSAHKEKGKVESLPPFEEGSTRFVARFVEATFALGGVGDISTPLRTRFGWHVVFLAEEIPSKNRSLEAVREEIARSLVPELRRGEAAALMQRLRKENKVFVYEDHLRIGNIAP